MTSHVKQFVGNYSSCLIQRQLCYKEEEMGKTMNAFSAQKKTKASLAALGWFSPMASSWQLMTARKLRELDPFSLPQASAPSNPKTQVYGGRNRFFLYRYTRRQAKRGLWNAQSNGSSFPERLAWP